MEKIKTIIYLTFLIFLFQSCEKIIDDFEFKERKTKIVLNGILKKDSLLTLHISKSIPAHSPDTIMPLKEASVKLYESGKFIENLLFDENGFYKTSNFITPSTSNEYKIRVEAKGLETVEATTHYPELPQVISIDTSYHQADYEYGYLNSLEIKIQFRDNSKASNYYMVELFYYGNVYYDDYFNEIYDTVSTYINPFIISDDEIIEIEYNGSDYWQSAPEWEAYGTKLIFSDKLINGKTHTLKLNIDPYNFYMDSSNSKNILYVNFHNVGKDYYEYMIRRAMVNDTENNPLVEPVTLYTNVKNGLGIFGARNTYTKAIEIKKGSR